MFNRQFLALKLEILRGPRTLSRKGPADMGHGPLTTRVDRSRPVALTAAPTGGRERIAGRRRDKEEDDKPRGRLELLDGCAVSLMGHQVPLPLGSQRLLALLALHERPLQRTYIAATLWADYAEQRSVANLRTALARLPQTAGRLVEVVCRQPRLSMWVTGDAREPAELA